MFGLQAQHAPVVGIGEGGSLATWASLGSSGHVGRISLQNANIRQRIFVENIKSFA